MQDCNISIAIVLEILQSCTKPFEFEWCTHECRNCSFQCYPDDCIISMSRHNHIDIILSHHAHHWMPPCWLLLFRNYGKFQMVFTCSYKIMVDSNEFGTPNSSLPIACHLIAFSHYLIQARRRIYASWNWVTFGSDNGLSPIRRQAIIWTNAGILLIGPWTNFSEILIKIQTFSFKKMPLKMSSAKCRQCCLGLNVLYL